MRKKLRITLLYINVYEKVDTVHATGAPRKSYVIELIALAAEKNMKIVYRILF